MGHQQRMDMSKVQLDDGSRNTRENAHQEAQIGRAHV